MCIMELISCLDDSSDDDLLEVGLQYCAAETNNLKIENYVELVVSRCRKPINMPIDFYYLPGSVPCRSVLVTAKVIGLEMNLIMTNVLEKDSLPPEFIKINPQRIVPTINDNGFVLWESQAIMLYLQNKYGKDDNLYPKDPKKRAVVDRMLFFSQILYESFAGYYYPILFGRVSNYDPAKLEVLHEKFKIFDTYLVNCKYAAADNLTLADLTLLNTVSSSQVFRYDLSGYENVTRWFHMVKGPSVFQETHEKDLQIYSDVVNSILPNITNKIDTKCYNKDTEK